MYDLRWPIAGAAFAALAGMTCAAWAQENGQGTAGDATVLPRLVIFGLELSEESLLGGGDASETGVSVLNARELKNRSDGTGDLNAVLKTLPNVQWQNDATSDGGTSVSREQDLRPSEVSISGANVYDNNFLLDGVEINRVAGSEGDADDTLEDDDLLPSADKVYGGHSQTVFVSPDLIESVTVHDSNVSAEYGRFQGGVVEYRTKDPAKDRIRAGFSSSFQSSDMVNFHIATEDGDNPKDRKPPKFYKDKGSVWLSGPLNERWSAMLSVGRNHAWGEKQREYQFVDQSSVETETFSETYMAKLRGETEIGTFSLQSVYAPYSQEWDSARALDARVDVVGSGSSTALLFNRDIGDVGPLKGLTFEATTSVNTSHSGRDAASNVAYFAIKEKAGHVSPNMTACRPDPGASTTYCRSGSYGDLFEDQTDAGFKFKSTANLFGHALKFGGSANHVDAVRERPEEVTLYSTYKTVVDKGAFTCDDPYDPACFDGDQFADRRATFLAYDVNVAVTNLDLYTEYDIDLGRFDLSLGLRADYETYQKNLNLAPRLSTSVEAFQGVTLTGGYGRYYANSMLAYALRDKLPKGFTQARDVVGGTVYNTEGGDGWSIVPTTSGTATAEGLRTPYTDEFSVGAAIEDPLFGGMLRLKGLRRFGKDQFARKENGSLSLTGTNTLTNDGKNEYTSASLEYARYWNGLDWGVLESVGVSGSLTWARRSASNDSYFVDDDDDYYIYYKGVSYTGRSFEAVTGNLDIPVRATLALNTVLWDGRLDLWTNANVTFAYTGVIDSGSNITFNGNLHDIYEDYRYRPTVTFNAGGRFTVTENRYGKADLEFRIDNLLDDIGNANASDNYPFKKGRVLWAGMNYTF